jgi:general secretion pathway protein C
MNAVSWLEGASAPDRWRGLLRARGPQIAVWALALALAAQAAIIVTRLAGAGRSAAAGPSAVLPQQGRHVDVAMIANSHLFGTAPVAVANSSDSDAPKTSMPLVLTGIIAARDPKDGLAILGENASGAKVYAVGDNVPGGARVQSVYEDRVLLMRDGHLESLTLPRQYSTGGRPSMAAAPAENPLDRMRRVLNDQPGLIADVMRPQPVFADGKQRGYRVYPGPNRQAFMRLGLRPGDLVTGINGTPLDDPTRGQEIFRTLGSSSEARVTVMRNGRQQDLTLNMTQLASEADQLSNPASPPPGTVVDPTTMTPAQAQGPPPVGEPPPPPTGNE